MAAGNRQVPSMDFVRNVAENWARWRELMELVLQGPDAHKWTEAQKAAHFLISIGQQGRDMARAWVSSNELSEDDKKKTPRLFEIFEAYCAPKKNITIQRKLFYERKQGPVETVDEWITHLRLVAADCSFHDQDEMLRDMLVLNSANKNVQEKLLLEDDLSLTVALKIAKSHEANIEQMKLLTGHDVHYIDRNRKPTVKGQRLRPPQTTYTKRSEGARPNQAGRAANHAVCGKCGRSHEALATCAAQGKICNNCGKLNHFAAMCRSAATRKVHPRRVHAIRGTSDDAADNTFDIGCLTASVNAVTTRGQPFTTLHVGRDRVPLKFKVDTGADINVLPVKTFGQLAESHTKCVNPTTVKLTGYGGHAVPTTGTCNIRCRLRDKSHDLEFYIADTTATPIIGFSSCLEMGLVKIENRVLTIREAEVAAVATETPPTTIPKDIAAKYAELFHGLGQFPRTHTMQLNPEIRPVIHAARRVPFALRDRLKAELDKEESLGVLVKVDEPTDWVNSIMIVEKKNGSLRICLDPKDLNKALKREHYSCPTVDDIAAKLHGARVFSVLDATSGYWQVKLDKKSSMLTTFNTPFGRYRFTRLPFGVNSAQDVFQKEIDLTYEGLPGVAAIVDDILIYGKNKEDHDTKLDAVLRRTKERGIRLNPNKCVFRKHEVTYFGHVLSADGLKPDPIKTQGIREMPSPTTREELETILGMVTYLGKFAPKLSEITAPLRNLTKKENEFIWDQNTERAYAAMKKLLCQQPGPILAYFDPRKNITLQCDASQTGLGAAMLQNDRPVSYASRCMTSAEENYAQIEKELLAVVFACERFHQYTYGRDVMIHSDHKPLEAIFNKPLACAPPRLQRMLLRLQRYNVTITYVPGKQIPLADTLSRIFQKTRPELPRDILEDGVRVHETLTLEDLAEEIQVCEIIHTAVTDSRMEKIRTAANLDQSMQILRHNIQSGWPNEFRLCPKEVRQYWNIRDELAMLDESIIIKGERIVIPEDQRREILEQLHTGHFGMEKTKQRARDSVYWPGINADIERLVTDCPVCQHHQWTTVKEPMMNHPIPDLPYEHVAADLFECQGKHYLCVQDYYSRYFEVERLYSTRASFVIKKMKGIFTRHGLPIKVVTDNGPQFACTEFAEFAKEYKFTHITSSPHYPQSNGLAEKAVQTLKRIITKSTESKRDPYLALLEYRTTPMSDCGQTPSQLLMERRLRSILPATKESLRPSLVNSEETRSRFVEKQRRQKMFYDRNASTRASISVGDPVLLQNTTGGYRPAIVTDHAKAPRSFHVQTENGAIYRRTSRHLRKPMHYRRSDDITARSHPSTTPEDAPQPQPSIELPTEEHGKATNADGQVVLSSDTHDGPPLRSRYGRTYKPTIVYDA